MMGNRQQPHKQRCETCHKRETLQCPIQNEGAYYKVKEYATVPTGWEILTSVIGCASHSSATAPGGRMCLDIAGAPKRQSLAEHDTTIEKAAREDEREKVLVQLTEILDDMPCLSDVCCRDATKMVLQSLRSGGK